MVECLRWGLCGFDLTVEFRKSLFKHLTQLWIARALQLLEHALPRESKSFYLADERGLLGRDLCF